MPLHPHNAALQQWLELGVPGAVLFALLVGLAWSALACVEWPPLFAAAAGASLTTAFVGCFATYGMQTAAPVIMDIVAHISRFAREIGARPRHIHLPYRSLYAAGRVAERVAMISRSQVPCSQRMPPGARFQAIG